MDSSRMGQKLGQSVSIIVERAIKTAGYDKTVQATVVSCADESLGKYRVRYQGGIWYAFASSPQVSYQNNQNVYVLIPNGDMEKTKTIIGTVDQLGTNYISILDEQEYYNRIGDNLIRFKDNVLASDVTYKLRSDANETMVLYDVNDKKNSDIIEDKNRIENYLKNADSFLLALDVQTLLSDNLVGIGNYGLRLVLDFNDNETGAKISRQYILDTYDMTGDRQNYISPTTQKAIYDFDKENFLQVNRIELFTEDFKEDNQYDSLWEFFEEYDDVNNLKVLIEQIKTKATQNAIQEAIIDKNITDFKKNFNDFQQQSYNSSTKKDLITSINNIISLAQNVYLKEKDIFISNLQFIALQKLSDEEIEGISFKISFPQGFLLNNNITSIRAEAHFRVQMKQVDPNNQNLKFYWFRSNPRIAARHNSYSSYAGEGWACKNPVLKNQQEKFKQFNPKNILTIGKDSIVDALAEKTNFKCVAVYNGQVFFKEFSVINLNADYKISISSSKGFQFFNDIGGTTLTCNVSTKKQNTIQYSWSRRNSQGKFKTISGNKNNIKVQAKNIVNFAVYECGIYDKDWGILGTAAVTLTNKVGSEGTYSIVLENADIMYVYNEKGTSPTNKSMENPQQIPILNLRVYNDKGEQIPEEVLRSPKANLEWHIPKQKTLIQIKKEDIILNNFTQLTEEEKSKIFDQSSDIQYVVRNVVHIPYTIVDTYDVKKNRNTINVKLVYAGRVLTTFTNFTFMKQGQPGTNGTDLSIKVVPHVPEGKQGPHLLTKGAPIDYQSYPMKIFNVSNVETKAHRSKHNDVNWEYQTTNDPRAEGAWFDVQMFLNGQQIFNDYTSTNDVSVNWSTLRYNSFNWFYENNSTVRIIIGKLNTSVFKTEIANKLKTLINKDTKDDIHLNTSEKNYLTDLQNQYEELKTIHDTKNKGRTCQEYINALMSIRSPQEVWIEKSEEKFLKSLEDSNENLKNAKNSDGRTSQKYVNILKTIKEPIFNTGNFRANFTYLYDTYFNSKTYYSNSHEGKNIDFSPIHILKVETQRSGIKNFYEFPLISMIHLLNDDKNEYFAEVEYGTGFRQIVYNTDGTRASYDNVNPFKINVYKKVGKDIVVIPGNEKVSYKYFLSGNLTKKKISGNTIIVVPAERFDGSVLNNALMVEVSINSIPKVFLHIPIHFMLNQYGHAALNDWDGVSIKINEEDGEDSYILAPQMGAGEKDNANRFTGIVMGKVKNGESQKNGLIGYSQGRQSIFLNAKDGSASFGLPAAGQIKIQPGEDTAYIQGGDYKEDDKNGSGMKMNLSSGNNGPWIKFGSGNFSVDNKGKLTAKGGGSIASWDIGDYQLTSKNSDGEIVTGINSQNKIEYDSNGKRIKNGVSIGKSYIAKTVDLKDKNGKIIKGDDGKPEKTISVEAEEKARAFWAGKDFTVFHDGYVNMRRATIGASSQKTNRIFISASENDAEHSAIFTGTHPTFNSQQKGFYLGSDGLSLKNTFSVDKDGYLKAKKGEIANWSINSNSLYTNKYYFDTSENKRKGMYFGENGLGIQDSFWVDISGDTRLKQYKKIQEKLEAHYNQWVSYKEKNPNSSYKEGTIEALVKEKNEKNILTQEEKDLLTALENDTSNGLKEVKPKSVLNRYSKKYYIPVFEKIINDLQGKLKQRKFSLFFKGKIQTDSGQIAHWNIIDKGIYYKGSSKFKYRETGLSKIKDIEIDDINDILKDNYYYTVNQDKTYNYKPAPDKKLITRSDWIQQQKNIDVEPLKIIANKLTKYVIAWGNIYKENYESLEKNLKSYQKIYDGLRNQLRAWKNLYKNNPAFVYDLVKIEEQTKNEDHREIADKDDLKILNELDKNDKLKQAKAKAQNKKDPNIGYSRLSDIYLDTFKSEILDPLENQIKKQKAKIYKKTTHSEVEARVKKDYGKESVVTSAEHSKLDKLQKDQKYSNLADIKVLTNNEDWQKQNPEKGWSRQTQIYINELIKIIETLDAEIEDKYKPQYIGQYFGDQGLWIGNNFIVGSDGKLTCKSGQIANWQISDKYLGWISSGIPNKTFTSFQSTGVKLTNSNAETQNLINNSIYFGTKGLRLGSNFSVDTAGNLIGKSVEISGDITANEGSFANYWNINSGAIFHRRLDIDIEGKKEYQELTTDNYFNKTNYLYFGRKGLSINDKFKVSNDGVLTAEQVNISGIINATKGGKIANWSIGRNCITTQDLSYGPSTFEVLQSRYNMIQTYSPWKLRDVKNITLAEEAKIMNAFFETVKDEPRLDNDQLTYLKKLEKLNYNEVFHIYFENKEFEKLTEDEQYAGRLSKEYLEVLHQLVDPSIYTYDDEKGFRVYDGKDDIYIGTQGVRFGNLFWIIRKEKGSKEDGEIISDDIRERLGSAKIGPWIFTEKSIRTEIRDKDNPKKRIDTDNIFQNSPYDSKTTAIKVDGQTKFLFKEGCYFGEKGIRVGDQFYVDVNSDLREAKENKIQKYRDIYNKLTKIFESLEKDFYWIEDLKDHGNRVLWTGSSKQYDKIKEYCQKQGFLSADQRTCYNLEQRDAKLFNARKHNFPPNSGRLKEAYIGRFKQIIQQMQRENVASTLYLNGKVSALSGNIGNWNIMNNCIGWIASGGSDEQWETLQTNGTNIFPRPEKITDVEQYNHFIKLATIQKSIYFGEKGIRIGDYFYVNAAKANGTGKRDDALAYFAGCIKAEAGNIANWGIYKDKMTWLPFNGTTEAKNQAKNTDKLTEINGTPLDNIINATIGQEVLVKIWTHQQIRDKFLKESNRAENDNLNSWQRYVMKNSIYFGKDGLRIGDGFRVGIEGNAFFKGRLESEAGHIANWTIAQNQIFSDNKRIILDSKNQEITIGDLVLSPQKKEGGGYYAGAQGSLSNVHLSGGSIDPDVKIGGQCIDKYILDIVKSALRITSTGEWKREYKFTKPSGKSQTIEYTTGGSVTFGNPVNFRDGISFDCKISNIKNALNCKVLFGENGQGGSLIFENGILVDYELATNGEGITGPKKVSANRGTTLTTSDSKGWGTGGWTKIIKEEKQ